MRYFQSLYFIKFYIINHVVHGTEANSLTILQTHRHEITVLLLNAFDEILTCSSVSLNGVVVDFA